MAVKNPKDPYSAEMRLKRMRERKDLMFAARRAEGWDSHSQEICDFLLPRSFSMYGTANNRNGSQEDWGAILDNTGTHAVDVLAAGMMAGMTSPARPWFRLATPDPKLMEYGPVKIWLAEVTQRMRDVFSRSNTYRGLHAMYEELSIFGTAVCLVDDSYDDMITLRNITPGQYAIATNDEGKVDTLYRVFSMRVEQLVKKFGKENCSTTVQNLWDRGKIDDWVEVVHVLEPNSNQQTGRLDNKNMAFRSCYFEAAKGDKAYLRDSGSTRFRALAPRWRTFGDDVMGTSPGMKALGDVKQLQHEQLRKAEGIDFQTMPPMQGPAELKYNQIQARPGGYTATNGVTREQGVRTLFETRLDLSHLLVDIQDVRARINSAFFADLFLMISQDSRSNITAEEIRMRQGEKLLMLGPVLERLHNEMLSPLIDITFERLQNAKASGGRPILPPPPPELAKMDLKVEFVSSLAQAQRGVALDSTDRLVMFTGNLIRMTGRQEAADKLNTDQMIDDYAEVLGTDPKNVNSDDDVAKIRAGRAQQQQAAAAAAAAKPMADAAQAAKALSETDTQGDNGLTRALDAYQGYGSNVPGLAQ